MRASQTLLRTLQGTGDCRGRGRLAAQSNRAEHDAEEHEQTGQAAGDDPHVAIRLSAAVGFEMRAARGRLGRFEGERVDPRVSDGVEREIEDAVVAIERSVHVELLRADVGLVAEVRRGPVRTAARDGDVEMNVVVVARGVDDAQFAGVGSLANEKNIRSEDENGFYHCHTFAGM